jgi:arginyl-tRNA--protein-N-Asp/Glu arginylyltransferase
MSQGPIQMSKTEAEELSSLCDSLTRMVENRLADLVSNPIIVQECRRVIAVQLIEKTFAIGKNHERLGDDPER